MTATRTKATMPRNHLQVIGKVLLLVGPLIGVAHVLINPPQRLPHMPALWDAVTGYPAAALIFILGIVLTQTPRWKHLAPSTTTLNPTRRTSMNRPNHTPDHLPPNTKSITAPQKVLYEEKLYPSLGIWVITVGLSTVPAIIFAPIDALISILASALTLAGLVFALFNSTPTIRVTPTELQVGRARIERQYVGRAQSFIGPKATAERGPNLHGLAFLCIRGWIDGVVRIELTDKEDKTPYWLVSTRRPKELIHTLQGLK